MYIAIHTINVKSIDGVGSLNIGKTVLCKNASNVINQPADGDGAPPGSAVAGPAATTAAGPAVSAPGTAGTDPAASRTADPTAADSSPAEGRCR
jgi:hypothetical protein